MIKPINLKQNQYFPNELLNRNLVALPNKVWVMDLCQLKTLIETKYKTKKQGTHCLKVFFVIDLGTREVILAKLYSVLNSGNVRSTYIVRQLTGLIQRRGIQGSENAQLILHSDRGSEFTSKEYKALFSQFPQCIASMSAAATPTDNSVAERFVRTLKQQVIKAGKWPPTFQSMKQAESFLKEKIRYFNEDFKGTASQKLPPTQMHLALTQEEHNAPKIVAHWNKKKGEVPDVISTQIHKFRKEATQAWEPTNWSPENSLKKTERYSAIAARGAMKQEVAHDEIINRLEQIQQRLETKPKRTVRKEMPLRDPASESVYDYLMALKRTKHISRYVWSRARIAITLLRFLGLRASDAASLTLKEIESGLRYGSFQVLQPKTGQYRVVVLTQSTKQMLEKLDLDIKTVFGQQYNKPLASADNSTKQIGKDQWIRSINRFMQPAISEFNLNLTSHSFRINYITKLLRTVPLQNVKTIIGHKDIRTTERYDRFVVDPKAVSQLVETALNEKDEGNQKPKPSEATK